MQPNQSPQLGGIYKLHSGHGSDILKWATCHHEVEVAEEMNKSLQINIPERMKPDRMVTIR